MDECLQVLERSAEFPSDEVLVTLVKVQRIADEAQKLLVRDVMGEAGAAPTHVFKKGMIHRLQTAREGISHSAWSNCEYSRETSPSIRGKVADAKRKT